MATLWWALLGLVVCGYFALAGYDYGVGMLLPAFDRDERQQRRVLGAFGPFFLANEVWLVAAVGLLFGAFPHLEERLYSAAYVLVVTLLLGLVTFTAAVQLRGRNPGGGRRGWTAGIALGALVTSVSWGLFLGNLVVGLPIDTAGRPTGDFLALFSPYALLWGLGFVALFALQGAVFLAVRAPAELTGRALRLARSCALPATGFLVLATAWGVAEVPGVTWRGDVVVAVAFAALAVVLVALRLRRARVALIASMLLSASPALLAGLLRFPSVLIGQTGYALDVSDAATAPETFGLLAWFAPPAIAVLLVVQFLTWRAHRGRMDDRSLLHF